MKKILILGSTGFIGKNIYEYLSEKKIYKVNAPTSKEVDIIDEEAVFKLLKSNYYDVVINAAVHNPRINTKRDSNKVLKYTLKMFYNFEKNQDLYGKMLYFGSGAEYDKRYDIKSVKENQFGKSIPIDDYGLAKYIIAKSIKNSSNIINMRLFGVFGIYEDWKSRFISNCCCKAIKNIPISIRQNVVFDYLYIEDLCKIVDWFIENKTMYKDYNITTGVKYELSTLAKKVLIESQKNLPIYICKGEIGNEYTANNDRLLTEMKELKFVNIDESIHKLYKYYNKNSDIIDLYSLLY